MGKTTYHFLLIALLSLTQLRGQEFNVTVKVNTPNIENVDAAVFTDLENKIFEFFNQTPWTDVTYQDHEKIKGNLTLTIIEEVNQTSFRAELDIIASRPVYGSTYETVLFNFRDRSVNFSFDQATTLRYNENSFGDNLSATLAFYAYIILGMDGDSFSLYGGDNHYNKARSIVQRLPASLQNDNNSGWSLTGNARNRSTLIDEIFNPSMRPIRKTIYHYHRLGLDEMHKDVTAGRQVMVTSLHELEEVHDQNPNAMFLNVFFLAKALELNEIFAVSPRAEKIEVFNMIRKMDAGNAQKYDKLLK